MSEPTTTADTIRALAARYGVDGQATELDRLVDKWSELSGESGEPSSEIEQMLINLRRGKHITPKRSHELFFAWMKETGEDR